MAENERTFEDVVRELSLEKRLTTELIMFYCATYTKADELARQKNELSDLVKDALVGDTDLERGDGMELAPKDSPYKLSVTLTDPKEVSITDWEAVARRLAKKYLGNGYKSERVFKTAVEDFTDTTSAKPQLRLNPPAINPDYKKL